jgi:Putative Actinobacterial Holin-X, holin superfamily III
MLNETPTGTEPSVTQLVSGILNDAQDLFKQQMALLRTEVQHDFQSAKEATISLSGGLVLSLVGGLFLCFMLVHLLHWGFPDMPLWVCFGLVGASLAIGGGVLIYAGYAKLSFKNLSTQSAQALKENVQWLTNPK